MSNNNENDNNGSNNDNSNDNDDNDNKIAQSRNSGDNNDNGNSGRRMGPNFSMTINENHDCNNNIIEGDNEKFLKSEHPTEHCEETLEN